MLKIKRTGGTVFYLPKALSRGGGRTVSNGHPRRDSAGNIDTDVQWRRVQIAYTVEVDRSERDNLWSLWKDSDPIITGASATNAFSFNDSELLTEGWVACTFIDTEWDFGDRMPGRQERYRVSFAIECSASDFDTNRRTV